MKLAFSKDKSKRIIRIVALVLCVALFVSIPAIPALKKAKQGKQLKFSAELAAAYQQKQELLHTDAHIAMIVPTDEPVYSGKLKKALNKYGMIPDVYTWAEAEASADTVFNADRYSALIYTEADGIPKGLVSAVSAYTRNMGGLICIGGPAFTDIYEKTASGYVKSGNMEGTYYTTKENERSGGLFLDCLCPAYQTFPITNAVRAASCADQGILPETEYPMPKNMFSPSPRSYGTGILHDRMRRFVPLIEAFDEKGEVAGYPAFILMTQAHGSSNYIDGIWASFNTTDTDFLNSDFAANAIACTAAYFDLRTFLYGGGASEYTYLPGESWTLGAETLSRNVLFGEYAGGSDKGKGINYEIKVKVSGESGKVFEKKFNAYEFGNSYATALGECAVFTQSWTPPDNGEYTVTAELYGSGVLMDRLTHPVGVYVEKPESERKFVTYEGNDMYLDGKVWKCYGVNYMPSSGITLLEDDYEKWTSSSAFDIDVVSKDLRRIKDIGFNAISVLAYHDKCVGNNNIITLLRLCEKYGLKVFFSIREYADPMYYTEGNRDKIRDMIIQTHIVGNDTVVGYDISWETMPNGYEPSWCNNVGMGAFDDDWQQWIIDNYGSVEAAQNAWSWSLNHNENGTVMGIDGYTRSHMGPMASKVIVAYNRWLWDWTSKVYGTVVDDIRSMDPDHMIGARNGMYTGWPNGRLSDVGWEYGALASALDFMGPEGYGYYSSWDDDFETAVYSVAYSRYSCDKPIIWFEFGKNGWSGTNYDAEAKRRVQAEYIGNINRMLTDSQSNGILYWWYAGGYRMGEASDYGIINPDGSDRAATKLLREFADGFKNGGKVKPAEVVVSPERDDYTFGVINMYMDQQSEFHEANSAGKFFGIRNAAAETTSLNTSLERISGLDIGPVRNLNACIRKVWYRIDGGEWTYVANGETITVPRGGNVYFKVTAVNNGNAKWICRKNAGMSEGSVGIGIETEGASAVFGLAASSVPGAVCVDVDGYNFEMEQDVPRHGSVTVDNIVMTADRRRTVVFRMSARDRAKFGDIYRVKIVTNG